MAFTTGGSADHSLYVNKRNYTKKGDEWITNMKTLEMMNEARKTNKTYISGSNILDMRYSASKGFHDENGKDWEGEAFYI